MSSSSHLLSLPAEMRNQIYKLALTSPNPLLLASRYDGRATMLLAEIDGITREFNQLKYVNKQIAMETENIELSYNDIMVNRTKLEEDPPAAQFLSWVYGMMSSIRSWPDGATIVLADDFITHKVSDVDVPIPDSARTMSYLAKFCNMHNAVTVHYHLPALNFARDEDGDEQDRLQNLDWNICQSALAACFYIPALITEDTKLCRSFIPWFDEWRIQEMASDAEYWKSQNGGFRVEELQAQNIYYLPSRVEDMDLARERVEAWYGSGSETAYVIRTIFEHGLKAALDIFSSR